MVRGKKAGKNKRSNFLNLVLREAAARRQRAAGSRVQIRAAHSRGRAAQGVAAHDRGGLRAVASRAQVHVPRRSRVCLAVQMAMGSGEGRNLCTNL